MTPAFTFLFGLAMLVLFGWYFATDIAQRKRILGTLLTVLLTGFLRLVDVSADGQRKSASVSI